MAGTTTTKLRKVHELLTFQENMRLVALPDGHDESSGQAVKRYMSVRGAWVPGTDLPFAEHEYGFGPDKKAPPRHFAAFGGHVYSQAGLAASRAFRETMQKRSSKGSGKKYGIHTTHGIFSAPGLTDRPYIYTVTPLSPAPSFPSLLVVVRQPSSPSTNPIGDHYPLSDADLPLGPICFTSTITFRPYYPYSPSPSSQPSLPVPRNNPQQYSQEPSHQFTSVQTRFASILGSRSSPRDWDFAPTTDLDWITSSLANDGYPSVQGTFPGIEMRKVDLRDWNAGKPIWERRELLLYRLLAPFSGEDAADAEVDSHIMCHAFEADRNGLLMVGNHLGFGKEYGRAASMTYNFVVHVDAGKAMMKYVADEKEAGKWESGAWWIQEAMFPRVESGMAVLMSRIWSPEGVHVATEYQDGIIQRKSGGGRTGGGGEEKGKL